ncbi:MAG: hypothetical protein HC844_18040 [Tabrizicola sp.]|nr:hypothetical protein [Tabrizicola sp.]
MIILDKRKYERIVSELIDAKAEALYAQHFRAEPRSFPAFVDADTLHRCGYFDSHPNAISFVGHMVEDFDAIEEFRLANSCSEGAHLPPHDHIHVDGMCLNPAACFPCYPTLTGKTFETGACYTWLGRVFRYESRNINGLDRLYEFNVRELVFVGSEGWAPFWIGIGAFVACGACLALVLPRQGRST